jgi:hypothetical protein
MRIYGINSQIIFTNQDIDHFVESTLKTFDTVGPRDFIVVREYSNEVVGYLTWLKIKEAYDKGKFLVRKAELYFKKMKDIKTVCSDSITKEIILEVTEKPRSLYVIKNGSNPKKLSRQSFNSEITIFNIRDWINGIEYPEENCPYPYQFEVKE